jgi:hypothetical protein
VTLFGLRLHGLPERLPGGGDKRCKTRRNYLISMSGLSGSSYATFGSKSQGRYDKRRKIHYYGHGLQHLRRSHLSGTRGGDEITEKTMSIDKSLLEKLEKLPAEKRQEVEKFVELLLNKQKLKTKAKLRQDWAGALRDYRDQYTSLELQKKALEWRGD